MLNIHALSDIIWTPATAYQPTSKCQAMVKKNSLQTFDSRMLHCVDDKRVTWIKLTNLWMLAKKSVERAADGNQLCVIMATEAVNAGQHRLQRQSLQRLLAL